MPEVRDSWSTQQLAEFLAVVSSFADEDAARRGAVERAAEALEAEVAAVVQIGAPVISVGFARGEAPTDVLIGVVRSGQSSIEIPGVGGCRVLTAALDEDKSGWLLVARAGDEDFSAQE